MRIFFNRRVTMTSRHHVLSRKASISLQTMYRAAHDLLPRIPTAALSAGLTTRAAISAARPPDNSDPAAILTIWYNKGDKFDLPLTTPSGRRLAFPALDRARSELDEAIRIDLSRQRYLFNDLIQAQASISYPSTVLLGQSMRGWKLTAACQAASNGRLDGWFHKSGVAEFRAGTTVETAR